MPQSEGSASADEISRRLATLERILGVDPSCPQTCGQEGAACPLLHNRLTHLEKYIADVRMLKYILVELTKSGGLPPEAYALAVLRARKDQIQDEIQHLSQALLSGFLAGEIQHVLQEKQEALKRVESEIDAATAAHPA